MSQFGTEPGTRGFNDLAKTCKKSPTIENYVRLRREHSKGEVEISTTGGIEFLAAQEKDLGFHGLDPDDVIRLFDADLTAQAEISLSLSRKKVISDTLIIYLIGCALDAMSWTDNLEITRELIVLIKQQLGALTSQYEIEQERHNRRSQATWIAAELLNQGKSKHVESSAVFLEFRQVRL